MHQRLPAEGPHRKKPRSRVQRSHCSDERKLRVGCNVGHAGRSPTLLQGDGDERVSLGRLRLRDTLQDLSIWNSPDVSVAATGVAYGVAGVLSTALSVVTASVGAAGAMARGFPTRPWVHSLM